MVLAVGIGEWCWWVVMWAERDEWLMRRYRGNQDMFFGDASISMQDLDHNNTLPHQHVENGIPL